MTMIATSARSNFIGVSFSLPSGEYTLLWAGLRRGLAEGGEEAVVHLPGPYGEAQAVAYPGGVGVAPQDEPLLHQRLVQSPRLRGPSIYPEQDEVRLAGE